VAGTPAVPSGPSGIPATSRPEGAPGGRTEYIPNWIVTLLQLH
jgi:hypothetical protein